jgi:WD40 repeat protein
LRRYLAGEPILARRIGPVERGRKWIKRRPAAAALYGVTAASVIVLLGLGGNAWHDAELRAETVHDLATARGQVAEQEEVLKEKKTEAQRLDLLMKQAQTLADAASDRARRIRYAADMQLAMAAWETNNIARVMSLLERQIPRPGEEDLRGFEWHYLYRLCHRDRLTLGAAGAADPLAEIYISFPAVALSADGKTLAVAAHEKKDDDVVAQRVRLWDVATGKMTGEFPVPEGFLTLAFTPDGRAVQGMYFDFNSLKMGKVDPAAAKADLEADLRAMLGNAPPRLDKLLRTYRARVYALDGRPIGEPEVIEPSRLRFLGRSTSVHFGQAQIKGHVFQPMSASMSADGKTLALGGVAVGVKLFQPQALTPDPAVLFLNLDKGEVLSLVKGFDGIVRNITLSPDGKTLAVVAGKLVKLCEVPSGKELRALKSQTATLYSATFSDDGKWVAAGGLDGAVHLWDANTGEWLNTLKGHRTEVTSVTITPDKSNLISVSADGVIKVWDPKIIQGPAHLKIDSILLRFAFSSDSKTLTAASANGLTTQWDAPTGAHQTSGQKSKVPLTLLGSNLAASPDGKLLAVAGYKEDISVREIESGKEIHHLKGFAGLVTTMEFAPDSRMLAVPTNDQTVEIWDAQAGGKLYRLPEHAQLLAFAPDGKSLATALSTSKDKTVKVWDVATQKELHRLPAHPAQINTLRFSHDGTFLAVAGGETVKVWHLTSSKDPLVIYNPGQIFRTVAFNHDGKRLATVSSRAGIAGEIKLWDTKTAAEVLSLALSRPVSTSVIQQPENRLTFSPDGTRLAATERVFEGIANLHNEVFIWDGTPMEAPKR